MSTFGVSRTARSSLRKPQKGGKTLALSDGGNTWEKTLVPAAACSGKGEKNANGRPNKSQRTLAGIAIRSTEWGPNVSSMRRHTCGANVQYKSKSLREARSAGFSCSGRSRDEERNWILPFDERAALKLRSIPDILSPPFLQQLTRTWLST